ncbi:hypothetical protein L1987_12320 [Smallanthus sonchifolius]|uniref:Uncharacterized protein n=1 Tax=Smallanthus sonchifolius TaxID=185202 RepID=A0ACB9JEB8_9ASTR|nr:hypothetical protein L1987_12320 [Smallanthus sonchifolius]
MPGYYVEKRFLTSHFIIDVLTALPLPQLAVLVIIPNLDWPTSFSRENLLKFIIFSQYVPRVIQTCLFYQKVTKIYGFLIKKAWAGAAFNFFLYVLATYVVGALWYLFAIESVLRCWHIACKQYNCHSEYLYCGKGHVGDYGFLNTSCLVLERHEIKDSTNFDFGIFLDALQTRVLETRDLHQKILYCSLWGLQSLSSLGQGLSASTFYGEMLFAYFIILTGLVLYALLFGNIQNYLQSTSNQSLGMEEMKEKMRESEDFMSNMSFPDELRRGVRRHQQYNWNKSRGVELDLDSFARDLPVDIRKDINRHLCFPLLKKVPTFGQMDEHILHAICDSLKQVPYPENSYLVQEGAPADQMLFIRRGEVLNTITDTGRTSHLLAGDFCGEEIIPWVLNPERKQLPFSTISVKALTNVEAFTLAADDLLYVASQFRLFNNALATGSETSTLSIGASINVCRFSSKALRILRGKRQESQSKLEIIIQKPTQPDFDDDVARPKLGLMRPLDICL